LDKKSWSVDVVPINGPDDLREITRGSDIEIVQLKPGKLQGSITHFGIGILGISLSRFSSEIRLRGPVHQDRVVLGAILESAGPITQWWKDVRPGDVGVFPALQESDGIHGGSTAYLLVSIVVPELLSMLGDEEQTTSIGDLAFEHGFYEAGRFASYYRTYFGETPSETIRSRPVSTPAID
jgi:AraC-like DNA-binding protein